MEINHCELHVKDLIGLSLILIVWAVLVWNFISCCFTGRASFMFSRHSFRRTKNELGIIGDRKSSKILYFLAMALKLLLIVFFSYSVLVPLFSPGVFDEVMGRIFTCPK
ncbi:hypothetical protein EYY89_19500 [Hafnia paralvei]|uniref:Uncharacterized protein n=1 Tax=Hafnia paralvei TaxID=546367 RepID=A0A4Q9EF03_9GAMM|nr:hypothetical protein EYY89_19500 [Hafnia paralvei]